MECCACREGSKHKLLHLSSVAHAVILPNRDDVLLYGVSSFSNHVVVHERFNGLPRVRFYNLETNRWIEAQYPDPVYNISHDRNPNFESDSFRLSFTSPTRPQSILSYDLHTGEYETLKVYPVLGGFDSEAYACERVWAEAGAQKFLTLYRKRLKWFAPANVWLRFIRLWLSVDFRSSWLSLLIRARPCYAHSRRPEMGRHGI